MPQGLAKIYSPKLGVRVQARVRQHKLGRRMRLMMVRHETFAVPVEREVGDHKQHDHHGRRDADHESEVWLVGAYLFDIHVPIGCVHEGVRAS
jgi:hypothetical protein